MQVIVTKNGEEQARRGSHASLGKWLQDQYGLSQGEVYEVFKEGDVGWFDGDGELTVQVHP